MAKHRRKNHGSVSNNMSNNVNIPNNNPFGIDPFQLMSLLGGNIDISSIGNMLSSMNTNGFNLGNLEGLANMAGINLNNMNNFNNMSSNNIDTATDTMVQNEDLKHDIDDLDLTIDLNKKEAGKKKVDKRKEKKLEDNDENLIFLKQLQIYIHPEKREFIERIIKAYCEGKI